MSRQYPTRDRFGYFHQIPTRWSDHDQLDHVNNTRFFTFDEDARLAYFQALWKDDPKFWKQYGFILAHLQCDFVAQLRHPATVEIGFRVAKLGGSSIHTEAAMFDGERLVAVTRGIVVWFDYSAQKPMPIPDNVRSAIGDREPLRPDGL